MVRDMSIPKIIQIIHLVKSGQQACASDGDSKTRRGERYLRGVLEPPERPNSHKHEHCCRAGHGPNPQMGHCQRQYRRLRPQHCISTLIEGRVSVNTIKGRLWGTEQQAMALILRWGTASANTNAPGRSTAQCREFVNQEDRS